jgi:hypothetical protein
MSRNSVVFKVLVGNTGRKRDHLGDLRVDRILSKLIPEKCNGVFYRLDSPGSG